MKTHLPVPERTLPPGSARRIRSTITADRLDEGERRPARSWLVPLAAALVMVALMTTAVLLWPNAARTEVAATPSAGTPSAPTSSVVEPSSTPTAVEASPPFATAPEPTFAGPADPTSGPTSPTDVFRTDRGPLSPEEVPAYVTYCAGEAGTTAEGVVSRYARRLTNGRSDLVLVVIRLRDGREQVCGQSSGGLLGEQFPEDGPGDRSPVVVFLGSQGLGADGYETNFEYAAQAGVARVQVRAVVRGKPQPWFEAEVHDGLAFLPMVNPGRFVWPVDEDRPRSVRFEHRAYDADGRKVPVRVLREQRR